MSRPRRPLLLRQPQNRRPNGHHVRNGAGKARARDGAATNSAPAARLMASSGKAVNAKGVGNAVVQRELRASVRVNAVRIAAVQQHRIALANGSSDRRNRLRHPRRIRLSRSPSRLKAPQQKRLGLHAASNVDAAVAVGAVAVVAAHAKLRRPQQEAM